MSEKVCVIETCGKRHLARGWCVGHYNRWRKDGDLQANIPLGSTPMRRFWDKVSPNKETGCWEWTGALGTNGYAQVNRDGVVRKAHRLVWEVLVGPIPKGLTIDHLCRVRHCVNPLHLEPVTMRQNILRGTANAAENARKTHCIHGHPLSGDNLFIRKNGNRDCRICRLRRNSQRS